MTAINSLVIKLFLHNICNIQNLILKLSSLIENQILVTVPFLKALTNTTILHAFILVKHQISFDWIRRMVKGFPSITIPFFFMNVSETTKSCASFILTNTINCDSLDIAAFPWRLSHYRGVDSLFIFCSCLFIHNKQPAFQLIWKSDVCYSRVF